MNKCQIAMIALCLSACATLPPLPPEQREFKFVEATSLSQKDAYNAALTYIAKTLGNSNFAIKVKDPEAGTIMTQIGIACPEMKSGWADAMSHTPSYNLEINTKDQKIRFVYDGYEDQIVNVDGRHLGGAFISTQAQAEALKTCASRHKDEMMKALLAKKSDNW